MKKVTLVYNAHKRRKATPRTQSLTATHGKKCSRLSGVVFLEEEDLPIQENIYYEKLCLYSDWIATAKTEMIHFPLISIPSED